MRDERGHNSHEFGMEIDREEVFREHRGGRPLRSWPSRPFQTTDSVRNLRNRCMCVKTPFGIGRGNANSFMSQGRFRMAIHRLLRIPLLTPSPDIDRAFDPTKDRQMQNPDSI
jgi:hypothetical protein